MDQDGKKKADARTPDGLRLVPPKMTKAEWQRRERTSVTLTRGDLEQLGQLAAIGRQVLRDSRPIAPNLKAAMSRLGIATHGL